MIKIKYKLTATQKSETVDIKDVDGFAQVISLGDSKRIIYQEGCGGVNTLDITDDQINLHRENEWVTEINFAKDDSAYARIITEEGEIRFDLNVLKLVVEDEHLEVIYELLQGNELIDTHHYTLTWLKEEEAWLEIH